ncbi:MAG: hypothetical protein Q7T55_11980 [Solirubrobacteraceae bacterium]|nr:hypothetical protein [Solirubrobacteraceae bacterium]
MAATTAGEDAIDAARADGEERRGRSRDRYGRDRRERAPRDGAEASSPDAAVAGEAEGDLPSRLDKAPAFAKSMPIEPLPTAPTSVQAPLAVAVDRASAGSARGRLPQVTPFELPLAQLAQIAEGSGLHWVNSDAERIAQAQAAIAAEPLPAHTARERPSAVVLDDGPLVLVETRRDLAGMSLPFERVALPDQAISPT